MCTHICRISLEGHIKKLLEVAASGEEMRNSMCVEVGGSSNFH